MKKNLVLLTALLIASVSGQAADWKEIKTGNPNLSVQIDRESYREYGLGEYLYAIKFKSGNSTEKIAYIKSNPINETLGIIYATDYEKETYKPNAIFANPRTFMKNIPEDSFLQQVNYYALNILPTELIAEKNGDTVISLNDKTSEVKNLKPVSFVYEETKQEEIQFSNMKEFTAYTSLQLLENWNPPKSGQNTQSIIIVTIGKDGSLQNYMFAQPSGDDATDRSIISAVEQCVPYAKLPKTFEKMGKVDVQFIFTYDKFRKYVD